MVLRRQHACDEFSSILNRMILHLGKPYSISRGSIRIEHVTAAYGIR